MVRRGTLYWAEQLHFGTDYVGGFARSGRPHEARCETIQRQLRKARAMFQE
jgi:hypothetical protein